MPLTDKGWLHRVTNIDGLEWRPGVRRDHNVESKGKSRNKEVALGATGV